MTKLPALLTGPRGATARRKSAQSLGEVTAVGEFEFSEEPGAGSGGGWWGGEGGFVWGYVGMGGGGGGGGGVVGVWVHGGSKGSGNVGAWWGGGWGGVCDAVCVWSSEGVGWGLFVGLCWVFVLWGVGGDS
uniref:Uncharacterized protein n=1 Tax=Knipowitschia caucasica TaxID=637954 RepID=A0AAV2LVW6_KNICA